MIQGTCHCGAVRWESDLPLGDLTSCNCSICRRLAALWAYGTVNDMRVIAAPEATRSYVQGDKSLALHHCATCGCTTHWISLLGDEQPLRMAVNARLADPADIASLRIRHLDGADTWKMLD